MASRPDPRRDRALLVAGVAAAFALSAVSDLRALATAGALALALFARGAPSRLRRVARGVVPVSAGLAIASSAWLRIATGAWPDPAPLLAVVLRAVVIAFVTLSVLERVDLLRAVAPSQTLTRLLVVTLAQIHALRLVARDARDGLRSRLPRRPGVLDLIRGAGGITAALLALAVRNARDVSDALRSRGY